MNSPVILFIPSPSISSVQLGPLTIRFYALCLIAGIIVAWMLGVRRWRARGGTSESFETILLWAIPIGIVGARIYHVLTHLGDYFGPDAQGHWWAIWEGGIAIYGAIGFGALAAWIVSRRRRVAFAALVDSLAPAIAIGQAIGRWGNWFNQELFGLPTTLPWGLEIDEAHRPAEFAEYATFHPTFLYESLWNLLVAGVLLWVDRKLTLGRGKVFALYLALYGFGRFFTEGIRTDPSDTMFGPLRQNQFAAALICVGGILLFAWLWRFRPGREDVVESITTPASDEPVDVEPADVELTDVEPADAAAADAEAPQSDASESAAEVPDPSGSQRDEP